MPARTSVSEAGLASVLDAAVDGIIVIDDQARILVFNKTCERLFGYAAAEMLGRNVKGGDGRSARFTLHLPLPAVGGS